MQKQGAKCFIRAGKVIHQTDLRFQRFLFTLKRSQFVFDLVLLVSELLSFFAGRFQFFFQFVPFNYQAIKLLFDQSLFAIQVFDLIIQVNDLIVDALKVTFRIFKAAFNFNALGLKLIQFVIGGTQLNFNFIQFTALTIILLLNLPILFL